MRYIDLANSGGPTDSNGVPDADWIADAQSLLQQLSVAPDKAARDALIEANEAVWKRLRDWLLRLSHEKCWYSEARDSFSVPEVEHYRPKKRCKRKIRGPYCDGYWWLAFDWTNYRICGKVGNVKKGDFFPLADGSQVASHNGLSIQNELPLLLDPACPGDPDLLTFDEDGACGPHADADDYARRRVTTTTERLNLNQGRVKKARQRIWSQCWRLIEECRVLALQLNQAAGAADFALLNIKKAELRRMVRADAEFSAVAKSCLLKSNISWVKTLATG
ncbi:MAG: hypothetical protein U0Q11_11750 [Vicinamibacterales bacterium]